jgi:hypothetical protein
MLETTPEGRKKIIEEAVPGATVRQDGEMQVVSFPATDSLSAGEAVINKPGLSQQDINTLSAQTLLYASPAKFTGAVKNILPRMGLTGSVEAGVNYLIQKGAQALGSGQETRKEEIVTAGLLGAGAEFAPAVAGMAARKTKEVFDKTATMKKVREGRIDSDTSDYVLESFPDKDPYPVEPSGGVISEAGEPVPDSPMFEQVDTAIDALPTEELPFIPEAPKGLKEKTTEAAKNLPFRSERVIESPIAEELKRQKVPPLINTTLRETNTATRNAARDVMRAHSQEISTVTFGGKGSAYDIIGGHFGERVTTVLDATRDAITAQSKAIDDLGKYKGADLDEPLNEIAFDFNNTFDEFGIDVKKGALDFSELKEGSALRDGEKEIAKHWTDLKNAKTAADLHDIKKNIQTKLKDSYNQKGNVNFDSETTRLLDEMQGHINKQLKAISPEYRDANAILSANIDAIKKLETAIPSLKKYDISVLSSDSPNITPADMRELKKINGTIGQNFRKLDTNYDKAQQIEEVIDAFDDLSRQYGYKPQVNVKALSRTLNSYKTRVGDRSGTFQGKIGAEIARGNESLLKNMGKSEKWVERGKAIVDDLDGVRGVSDENAQQAIFDYIDDLNKRAK